MMGIGKKQPQRRSSAVALDLLTPREREVLVAVNKKVGSEDSPVKDGDVVKLTHQSKTSYDGVRDIPT